MNTLSSRHISWIVLAVANTLLNYGALGYFQSATGVQGVQASISPTPVSNQEMSSAATHFIDSLSPELRAKAVFAFDSPQHHDWHFVPRTRPGLAFRDMTDPQRIAARALLRTALSSQGLLKTESIMALDSVLYDMERAAGGDGAMRDPLNYSISIFGSPADSKPWGWRIEGHHLCLNFTAPTNDLTAVTPSFMGSNPAEVRQGPRAGHRVLALEEDLGRELVTSLDEAQRVKAIISKEAPPENSSKAKVCRRSWMHTSGISEQP